MRHLMLNHLLSTGHVGCYPRRCLLTVFWLISFVFIWPKQFTLHLPVLLFSQLHRYCLHLKTECFLPICIFLPCQTFSQLSNCRFEVVLLLVPHCHNLAMSRSMFTTNWGWTYGTGHGDVPGITKGAIQVSRTYTPASSRRHILPLSSSFMMYDPFLENPTVLPLATMFDTEPSALLTSQT